MNIFASFEMGRTALRAQMKGMQVSGQNVANANTPGYSRQRTDMVSIVPAIVAGYDLAPGRGVNVEDVVRINSEFYHGQMIATGSTKNYWGMREEGLSGVEVIFMEPSEQGINKYMEDFFDTWHELSSAPESMAVRMGLVERTVTFAQSVQNTYDRMTDLRFEFIDELELRVDEINGLADQIASINESLTYLAALGQKSNETMDRLDLALEELGELIDIRHHYKTDGSVEVMVGGRILVQEDQSFHLSMDMKDERPPALPTGLEEFAGRFVVSGEEATTDTGFLRGDAEKGYHLVVDSRESTSYELVFDEFEFTEDEMEIMEVFVQDFTGPNDEDMDVMREELQSYYLNKYYSHLDEDDDDYENELMAALNAIDEVLDGNAAMFTVDRDGNAALADNFMGDAGDPFVIAGDSVLGTFNFMGVLSNGNNNNNNDVIRNSFDFTIRDTVDSDNLYPDYELYDHRGQVLMPFGGRTVGLLDMINDVVPETQTKVNDIMNRLVVEVNKLHREGYGLDRDDTGRNFFLDIQDNNIPPALQFFLNEELISEPTKIAASSEPNEAGNAEIALETARLRHAKLMHKDTVTITDYYRGMITQIGVKGQESHRMYKVMERAENQLREKHEGIAGVNIDEEMLDMVQFQHSWQAAARFVNYIDQMISVLLNEVAR